MPTVEIFADVTCPFTYVGLVKLLAERDRRGLDVRVRLRAWPLEIVNGEPTSAEYIAEEIADIRRQVAPDLFTGFTTASFPASSIPALALTDAAFAVGADTGEGVAMELRRLLFEEAQNIGDDDVLAGVAGRWRVPSRGDVAAVRADHAEGVRRGVVGSPHMFVGGYSAFCPVLRIRRQDDGHLEVRFDEAGFESLIQQVAGA